MTATKTWKLLLDHYHDLWQDEDQEIAALMNLREAMKEGTPDSYLLAFMYQGLYVAILKAISQAGAGESPEEAAVTSGAAPYAMSVVRATIDWSATNGSALEDWERQFRLVKLPEPLTLPFSPALRLPSIANG